MMDVDDGDDCSSTDDDDDVGFFSHDNSGCGK